MQRQTIAAVLEGRLIGESEPMQGPINPVTALVTGKHPARAIASMCRGCQTNDQEPCLRIAEAGPRIPPVLFLPKFRRFSRPRGGGRPPSVDTAYSAESVVEVSSDPARLEASLSRVTLRGIVARSRSGERFCSSLLPLP